MDTDPRDQLRRIFRQHDVQQEMAVPYAGVLVCEGQGELRGLQGEGINMKMNLAMFHFMTRSILFHLKAFSYFLQCYIRSFS